MKKIYLLFLTLMCLCSLSVYADSPCDNEMGVSPRTGSACEKPCPKPCEKTYTTPCQKPCEPKCPQTYTRECNSECFLCTNKNMNSMYSELNLSETQICTTMKIQDKYNLEVLSINERIACEEENLNRLAASCTKGKQFRDQKNLIKDLKKKRKEICKCYEKQFEAILSDPQKRAYRKYKRA